jgi:hypothetical protein
MQFQVPQYIDIEDKLVGPLTFPQFIYLAGGAGLGFLLYRVIPNPTIGFLIALPVVLFAIALAFWKINRRPFLTMLQYAITHVFRPKLFIWKNLGTKRKKKKHTDAKKEVISDTPQLTESRLKDLTWSLDVQQEEKDALERPDSFRPLPDLHAAVSPQAGMITPPAPPQNASNNDSGLYFGTTPEENLKG